MFIKSFFLVFAFVSLACCQGFSSNQKAGEVCRKFSQKSRLEFKPIQQARPQSNEAALKAKNTLVASHLDPADFPDLFLKYYLDAGGFIFLDMDPALRYGNDLDAEKVNPSLLDQRVVFDHHGGYKHHKSDTTQQIIEKVTQWMENPLKSKEEKLIAIQSRFQGLTTDNLGDANLAIWVLNHLDELVEQPGFLSFVQAVTQYEDFGVFGVDAEREAKLKNDLNQLNSIEIAQAVLAEYEKIIKKYKLSSDRFDSLSPDFQKNIISKMQKSTNRLMIQACLNSQARTRLKLAGASEFRKNRQTSKYYIKKSNRNSMAQVARDSKSWEPDSEVVSDLISGMNRHFYLWNEAEIPKSLQGFFTTPSGAYQVDPNRIQVKYHQKKGGEITFIIAYPYGAEKKLQLQDLEPAFAKVHLLNFRKSIETDPQQGKLSEERIHPLLSEEEQLMAKKLVLRDGLIASYSGLRMSLAEFSEILAKFAKGK